MNNYSNKIAESNLAMLKLVAIKLGELNKEVVYLGGSTTALFITDPTAVDIRSTLDVDCITDVVSTSDYYRLEDKLREKGFKKSIHDTVICRWHYDDLIVDIMPTNEKILGFGNRWYSMAIKSAITHRLSKELSIKSVTAEYFLGTKLEAFKTRGNNDFLNSHDLEDIVTVIDGRASIVEDIGLAGNELKTYLIETFSSLLKNEQFCHALQGHLNYGPATQERAQTVFERIKEIASLTI